MKWPESLLNPGIRGVKAYVPGKPAEEIQRELGLSSVIKMASNENPIGPSPRAMEALCQTPLEYHLYPDAGYLDSRKALGVHVGLGSRGRVPGV